MVDGVYPFHGTPGFLGHTAFLILTQGLDFGLETHHLRIVVGIGKKQVLQPFFQQYDGIGTHFLTEQRDLGVESLQLLAQQILLCGKGSDFQVDLIDLVHVAFDIGHLGLLIVAQVDFVLTPEIDDGVFRIVELGLEQGDLFLEKATGAVALLPLSGNIPLQRRSTPGY
ncbi:MAG: hypothetical protein R2864_13765 [Syntrophotaleaceae bacterium]